MTVGTAIEVVWADIRYAGRSLRRSPGFAVVAALSLALGVGANAAIFQILDAVRLRSLPVRNPQELAEVRIVGGNGGMGLNSGPYGRLTRPMWEAIRDHQQAFSGAFAWSAGSVRVGPMSDLRRAKGLRVSGEMFDVLGIQPWRGRLLRPEDEASACPTSRAVVSYAYWQREMGGRELGRDTSLLLVDGDPVEVIGVTPPGFFGLAVGEGFDIAGAFCRPKDMRRDVFDVAVIGRLRPGWTIERASAHLASLSPGVLAATEITGYRPDVVERYKRFRFAAYEASGGLSALREEYDSSLWLLLAITGLVLLIACANLANLMLARASARGREIAVRVALGASRGRLMGQLLVESALLAAAGAALGIALAQGLSRALVSSLGAEGAVNLIIETDWRVLLFTAAVAAATCLVFGVTPAWRASGLPPEAALRVAGRGLSAGRDRLSLQRVMVVAQIAVSLVLLVGALLFVRSFRNLMAFDPGLRQDGITVAFVGWKDSTVPAGQRDEFRAQLLDEVRAVPGVLGAATTTNVPLLGSSWTHGVTVGTTENSAKFTWVSPGYFETMGMRLWQGRDLERHDTRTSTRVAVVNQAFVRSFLAGADPIGKTLRTAEEPGYPSTMYEIVGVVSDSRYSDIRGGVPAQVFAPATQFPANGPWASIMVRSEGSSASVVAGIKRRVAAHPEVAVEFLGLRKEVEGQLVRDKLMAMLSGFFGLLAVLLATVGLYGVIAYLVASRRSEIGIRMALGAQRTQVVRLIMGEAGRLLAIGAVAGTLLALAATRGAASLLFGLPARDPLTFAAALLVLSLTAGAAGLLPALRAARLDPMVALRQE